LKIISKFFVIFSLFTIILTLCTACSSGGSINPSKVTVSPSEDWPMFRNNAEHNGVTSAHISLPLKLKWTAKAGDTLLSSPAISGNRLFVGSFALDATTGKKLWSFQTDGPVTTSPAVSGNSVFLGSYEMNIYSRDATTGKELWKFQTGD
jgi:eukaryotic-like serine/threonine-protein kinase